MSTRNFCFSLFLIATLTTIAQNSPTTNSSPPFHGTIFLDPDIITANDPTSFQALADAGQGSRTMFDRRVNNWITVNAYLFTATYDDGLSIEIRVNPEFINRDLAEIEAYKYAKVIGQLPTCLRQDVRTASIHKGTQLFGGGNNDILIHTGQTALYEKDGILEETLIHEATHTSLDAKHALSVDWLRAQQDDPMFISKYAQENPKREDLAETFLLYIALALRGDRISDELKQTVGNGIPNRLYYFERQALDYYPLLPREEKIVEPPIEVEVAMPTPVVEAAELRWVAFDGMVPENSVSGGQENGNDLPVCRGNYNGVMHPGKLLSNKCNIGYGGKEIQLSTFDVLVNTGVPLVWMPYTGNIPEGAIEGGNENGRLLYVGQFTRPDGSIHTGKVFGIKGGHIFNYGYGGMEITEKSNFRILVR